MMHDCDDKEYVIFSENFKLKKNETDGEREDQRTTARFLIFDFSFEIGSLWFLRIRDER